MEMDGNIGNIGTSEISETSETSETAEMAERVAMERVEDWKAGARKFEAVGGWTFRSDVEFEGKKNTRADFFFFQIR